ncbi:TPA: YkgJ family cysteine cluster protein [Campylobacter lari]|uniref:YkgJ family cysteine cluster protein n=1 Tax=Campylobacter sp. FU_497 TaxID=2911610 RepID=UPI0021E68786|nr:YkgJ family cysteine cluster protein [Campylobacter sp. FU_497]MCV3463264.1 YkgJ family cysteine cluster protein [Campylobacter sp. FU_497]HEC1759435.1 YkgJ family cysteine cluster protein [Campylobacter lari]
MLFPCTQCGLCCKNISNIKELASFDLGNGVCKFLDLKTNKCKIYKKRPDVCDVGFMYKKFFKKYYSEDEFIHINMQACQKLQDKFNKN